MKFATDAINLLCMCGINAIIGSLGGRLCLLISSVLMVILSLSNYIQGVERGTVLQKRYGEPK